MSEAKIRLSQKELELVGNADLILTKNAILQKVNQLLGELLVKQQHHLELSLTKFSGIAINSSPKISKGENYNGLPYLILDYPRLFDRENILAIRTMFWWGNFFSITLHLSGTYKREKEKKLLAIYPELIEKGFFLCTNADQWEHHFDESNYTPLTQLNKTDLENELSKKSFIKLAAKISLQQWNDADEILLSYFKQIIEILAD